jgi:hypothetical protein
MSDPRNVLLFEAGPPARTWNEQMQPGEFAVHRSTFDTPDDARYCLVFPSLAEAEQYARRAVAEKPTLRCMIYSHQGTVGAPVRDIHGAQFKANDMSPRFRRWAGGILFGGGVLLIVIDWVSGFRLSWPAMIGTRVIIPGAILLFTEAMVILHHRSQRQRAAHEAVDQEDPR